jgi:hypothetical protein
MKYVKSALVKKKKIDKVSIIVQKQKRVFITSKKQEELFVYFFE